MSEEKEGKILSGKDNGSSVGGSSIKGGVDDQITNIEEQLKKAQNTLEELQSLKEKLEEDRKKNLELAKKEDEQLNAHKLLEENTKLKTELKNYQEEINSFKGVIASLKEDLAKDTEQLQKKVASSLKILEEADGNHGASKLKVTDIDEEEKKPEQKESDSVDINKDDESNKVESKDGVNKPEEKIETKVEEKIEEKIEEPKSSEDEKTEVKEKETDDTKAEEKESPEDDGTKAIEDELLEYEKIKKELELMETGDLPADSQTEKVDDKVAEEVDVPPKQEEKEEEKKSEPVKDEKKDEEKPAEKEEEKEEEKKNTEKVAIKVVVNQNPPKDDEKEKDVEKKLDLTKNEEKKETPVVKKEEEKKPKRKRFLLFFKKKERETKVPINIIEVSEHKDEDKPKEKKGLHLFKKKKKRAKEEEKEEHHKDIKADTKSGGLLMKTAVLFVILFLGGVTYQFINAEKTRKVYIQQVKTQVKGASDSQVDETLPDFAKTGPEERYKEAYTDLPFDQTNWVNYNDPELGIKIDYPNNTSNKYTPVYSVNVWFLRKNGYLMKMEKDPTTLSLDKFVANYKTDVKYTTEKTILKGFPAIHMIQNEYLEVRGNIYFVKAGDNIYTIWYKTFTMGENTDDEQRVKEMLASLEFLNVKPPAKSKSAQ